MIAKLKESVENNLDYVNFMRALAGLVHKDLYDCFGMGLIGCEFAEKCLKRFVLECERAL